MGIGLRTVNGEFHTSQKPMRESAVYGLIPVLYATCTYAQVCNLY